MVEMHSLDGCPEYDERLLESAFAPGPDAELDRHLVTCARCRTARDHYLRSADAITEAIGGGLECHKADQARSRSAVASVPIPTALRAAVSSAPRTRSLRHALLAAAALVLAVLGAWWWNAARGQALHFVLTGQQNETLVEGREGLVHLLHGSGRFTFTRSARVATPLGSVRAEAALVEIEVLRAGESTMNGKQVGVSVTVAVLAGTAWWCALDGSETPLAAGERLVRGPVAVVAGRDRADGTRTELDPSVVGVAEGARISAASSASVASPSLDQLERIVLSGTLVDDRTGRPVPSAEVWFGVAWEFAGVWEGSTQSAEDGTFVLTAPRAHAAASGAWSRIDGDPILVVKHPRHALLVVGGPARNGLIDVARLFAPVELGELRLASGTFITGRVLDAHDCPVPGARLYRARNDELDSFFLADGLMVGNSDDAGRIVLVGRLSPPEFGSRALLVVHHASGYGWGVFDLLAGRERIDDLVVRIPPQGELTVIARDEPGAPLADVEIAVAPRCTPFDARPHDDESDAPWIGGVPELAACFRGRTDAEGRVVFASLPCPGGRMDYRLVARKLGLETVSRPRVGVDAARGGTLELVVRALKSLTFMGRVRDERGAPVPGATMRLRDRREADGQELELGAATSGADGSFVLTGTPDPRDPAWQDELWFEACGDGFSRALRLLRQPTPEERAAIDFELVRALPIVGRVVDDAGAPLPGVNLWAEQGSAVLPMAVTDVGGRFTLADATAGEWRLWLRAPDPIEAWSVPAEIRFAAGTLDARIVLERETRALATVVASIVDADTGAPLDPMDAMLLDRRPEDGRDRPSFTPQRSAGLVRCTRVLEGDYDLWVVVAGRPMTRVLVRVEPGGGEARVEMRVGRCAHLDVHIDFGVLAPESGRLEAGLMMEGGRPGGGVWSATGTTHCLRADAGPEVALEGLVPGRWWITFEGRACLAGAEIELGAGAHATLVLEAVRPAYVTFRAEPSTPGDWLLCDLEVLDAAANPWPARRLATQVFDGRLRTEQLVAPGRYRWRAVFGRVEEGSGLVEQGEPRSGEIELAAGERQEIVVR